MNSNLAFIKFDLPYPPSINNYYNRTLNGVFLKKKVKNYIDSTVLLLKNKIAGSFGNKRVRVELHVRQPDNRRRDIDNILKCTLDIIQKLKVYEDDSQIVALLVMKKKMRDDSKIEVIVGDLFLDINDPRSPCNWCDPEYEDFL